ncbi:MAG TPA: ATP-binding cassette domain-containing protein [Ramlibacter sp.]|nr:ATP-binding cassette domain-containing protein [Ramlibacter sp.]
MSGLRVRGLRKTFHAGTPDERVAVDGIDLDVPPRQFLVVIGGNGAGKSTLLNLLSGAVAAEAGHIELGDADITRWPEHRRAARIARVFQDPMKGTAPLLTLEENLALAELRARGHGWRPALNASRRSRYREVLAPLGLGLQDRLQAQAGLLSGGQRQALALVMATLQAPDLLLLDEHTAALDPITSERVMTATRDLVAAQRLTTLMVTHNMQHALDHGERILMLDQGRVRADIGAEDKRSLDIAGLVGRFRTKDDRVLLA